MRLQEDERVDGLSKFDSWVVRKVEMQSDIGYIANARYFCSKGGKSHKWTASSSEALRRAGLPLDLIVQLPVVMYESNAVTVELGEMIVDIMSSFGGGASMVCALIAKNRVSAYLKAYNRYVGHLTHYKALCESNPFLNAPEMVSFPDFFSHCRGYNGSLGPSADFVSTLLFATTEANKEFYNKYRRTIKGLVLSEDHHHNICDIIVIQAEDVTCDKPICGYFNIT